MKRSQHFRLTSVDSLCLLAIVVSFVVWDHFQSALAFVSTSSGGGSSSRRSRRGNNLLQNHFSFIMKATPSSTGSRSASTTNPLPNLPIPEPICSNVPGTWAYDTMSRRVNEEILERTVQDCAEDLSKPAFAKIRSNIDALRAELSSAATTKLSYLDKEAAPSDKEWQEWYDILQPYITNGDTWLTAPWMVTEFYVYRRLMQCFQFWTPNQPGYYYDPFRKQKQAGLISSVGSSEPALKRIAGLPTDSEEGLQLAVSLALWCVKICG